MRCWKLPVVGLDRLNDEYRRTCASGIRRPVIAFSMVVKAAAKKTSNGSSAMALEIRYSKLEYLLLICSRSTTGRSLANRLIVFISAICQSTYKKG